MMKRQLTALAIAAVLAAVTSLIATTGVLALNSSPRSTVTPPPSRRVQQPQAAQVAKIKTLENALSASKMQVKALEKALAKAKTPVQRKALADALAKAKAKVKALERSLVQAKRTSCAKGTRYVNGKCRRA